MSETTTKPTAEDYVKSLTGFDEMAITRAFGTDCSVLLAQESTTTMRALVFVAKRRDGLNDSEAKTAVMEMPLGDVLDFFAEPDGDGEDLDTSAGEGDSQPA